MSVSKEEVQRRAASELDRNDCEAAVRILRDHILSLGVEMFAAAVGDRFEQAGALGNYIETFVNTVSPVRNVKSLILQIDEVDLGSNNWVCWPLTATTCSNPYESDQSFDYFTNSIQASEGYPPHPMQGFHKMKAAFDWYNDLSSAERQTWNLQEAKEFAYHLVLVRFYQWLSAACKQLMVAGRVSSSLCVFAAEYAGDFFYCVTPENLAGH